MDSTHTPPENVAPDSDAGSELQPEESELDATDLDLDDLAEDLEGRDPADAPAVADRIADVLAGRLEKDNGR